ncbi:Putative secreted protein (modular protein) [Xanthomonas phaseoli pv. phaseoli]|nr:Putative secreted protein (modular protein) [Xanthomonas phaseoli pv. phaseoli]
MRCRRAAQCPQKICVEGRCACASAVAAILFAPIAGWSCLRRKKKECMRHWSASTVRPLGTAIGNVPVLWWSKRVGNRPPGALYPSSPPKNRTRAPRDNALLPAIGKLCRLGGDNEKKFCDIDVHAGIAGSGAVGLQVQRCKAGDGLPVHAVRRRRRAEALDQASRAGFDGNGNSCAGRYASGVRQKPGIKPGLTPDQL